MKITVKTIDVGLNIKEFITKTVKKESESIIENLAKFAENAIKNHIKNTSRLSTGTLASAFFAEDLSSNKDAIWGVGDIDTLNKNHKYWKHLNYGSEAIGANWEHWLPKGHWENGRWIEGDGLNDYYTKPKTPIQAHNYIEKTLADIDVYINSLK